jgi:steroid 5-alpha reductase family enzyme
MGGIVEMAMTEIESTDHSSGGQWLTALAVLGVSVVLAGGVALAGDGGGRLFGAPVMLVCVAAAFAVQWLAFIPAFVWQTEHFYDLTGGITYTLVVVLALASVPELSPRVILLAALVILWAVRLSGFLFLRVRRVGSDGRFAEMKKSAPRFLIAWTLQGLWVSLTLAAALAVLTTTEQPPMGPLDGLGLGIWLFGFLFEVVADRQKNAFRRALEASPPAEQRRFIAHGLWAWSRHPNYFGEIVLWVGVAVMSSSVLAGWQWLTLISPVFVTVLLTRVSGVPLLEERADARWGGEEDYEAYKARTPVLVPRPPRAGTKS